jgi:hypothetical protein
MAVVVVAITFTVATIILLTKTQPSRMIYHSGQPQAKQVASAHESITPRQNAATRADMMPP